MRIFDSHAHYDDSRFDGERDELLKSLHTPNGDGVFVDKITNIGASLETSAFSLSLAGAYDFMYTAVGVHPSDAASDMMDNAWLDKLEEMAKSTPKVVAIGEIGLDYHYGKDTVDEQKICFEEQMKLADKLSLPVVIHDREAHEDTLNILRKFPNVRGVVHSFSGSFEMAKDVLKMGYYFSVNGVITFKNAKKIVDILCRIDELAPDARERLLVETDCPYLTPEPFRGRTNRSDYIRYTAEKGGDCLGISADAFADLTYRNACRFYGISEV